jgi:hypothetical protein
MALRLFTSPDKQSIIEPRPIRDRRVFGDDTEVPEYTRDDIVSVFYLFAALQVTQERDGVPVPLADQVVELARRAIRFAPRPSGTLQ